MQLLDNGVSFKLERTRTDGTTVETCGNPLPDGGFVMTYTDITGRNRIETAVRDSDR